MLSLVAGNDSHLASVERMVLFWENFVSGSVRAPEHLTKSKSMLRTTVTMTIMIVIVTVKDRLLLLSFLLVTDQQPNPTTM